MRSSSYGSRRATTWAVAQKPRPMPRVVRLGRPANDNLRRTAPWLRALAVTLVTAMVVLALYDFGLL